MQDDCDRGPLSTKTTRMMMALRLDARPDPRRLRTLLPFV